MWSKEILESKHSTRTEDYRSCQLELNDLINDDEDVEEACSGPCKGYRLLPQGNVICAEKAANSLLTEDVIAWPRLRSLKISLRCRESLPSSDLRPRIHEPTGRLAMTSFANLRFATRPFKMKDLEARNKSLEEDLDALTMKILAEERWIFSQQESGGQGEGSGSSQQESGGQGEGSGSSQQESGGQEGGSSQTSGGQ